MMAVDALFRHPVEGLFLDGIVSKNILISLKSTRRVLMNLFSH